MIISTSQFQSIMAIIGRWPFYNVGAAQEEKEKKRGEKKHDCHDS